jgi:hypothetical protein
VRRSAIKIDQLTAASGPAIRCHDLGLGRVGRWYRMRLNGEVTSRAALKSGDTVEVGMLRLTFPDEVR